MPIVYIHGVYTREPKSGLALGRSFRRWLGPKLNPADPESVEYIPIFWGDIAASFRWKLESRPRTAILRGGAGGVGNVGIARTAPRALMKGQAAGPAPGGPVIGGPAAPSPRPVLRLAEVRVEERADLLSDLYVAAHHAAAPATDPAPIEIQLSGLPVVAAEVADAHWDSGAGTDEARLAGMLFEIERRLTGVRSAGASDWFARAGELAKRALMLPGDVVSTLLAESRPALNGFVSNFIGDVLIYINERGRDDSPGPIPQRVIAGMRAARAAAGSEPVVVVTHSMGGQLFYDYLVNFAAHDRSLRDFRIDHWISCGSQVSLFAELTQFLDQDRSIQAPDRLGLPKRVAAWSNFYDPNDFVGFIMQPVFAGVHDHEYDTGAGLIAAHTSYLQRPSFFQRMAEVL